MQRRYTEMMKGSGPPLRAAGCRVRRFGLVRTGYDRTPNGLVRTGYDRTPAASVTSSGRRGLEPTSPCASPCERAMSNARRCLPSRWIWPPIFEDFLVGFASVAEARTPTFCGVVQRSRGGHLQPACTSGAACDADHTSYSDRSFPITIDCPWPIEDVKVSSGGYDSCPSCDGGCRRHHQRRCHLHMGRRQQDRCDRDGVSGSPDADRAAELRRRAQARRRWRRVHEPAADRHEFRSLRESARRSIAFLERLETAAGARSAASPLLGSGTAMVRSRPGPPALLAPTHRGSENGATHRLVPGRMGRTKCCPAARLAATWPALSSRRRRQRASSGSTRSPDAPRMA